MSKKKKTVSEFRKLVTELISSKEIEDDEYLNQVYESFIWDFSDIRKIKFYNKTPKLLPSAEEDAVSMFFTNPILKANLQKKNVMLSKSFWEEVVLAEKHTVQEGFVIAQGDEKSAVDLTQLQIAQDSKGNPLIYVKLIRIKIDEEVLKNKKLKTSIETRINSMLTKGIVTLQEVQPLIERCEQFSIQEYLLPEGYADKNDLRYATLLYRYDRVYGEIYRDRDRSAHFNASLPAYYESIYPICIPQKTYFTEAHMHFLEGVSTLSKQDDVKDKKNNFGAGFALPYSNVRGYLMKILLEKYKTEEEKQFYLTNSFGMPFLAMLKRDRAQVEAVLDCLNTINGKESPYLELIKANKMLDIISNLSTTQEIMVD